MNKFVNQNTLVKISTIGTFPESCIYPIPSSGSSEVFKFNKRGTLFMGYHENIMWRNGSQIAEIDMRPLSAYPEYEHHLHIQPYNEQNPFVQCAPLEILVDFIKNQTNQGIPNDLKFQVTLLDAELYRDTELLTKMDPYVKLIANGLIQHRSSTIKKGDKNPNFNQQKCLVSLLHFNNFLYIEVWDEDMRDDDLVGRAKISGRDMLALEGDLAQLDLYYGEEGEKEELAGKVRVRILRVR